MKKLITLCLALFTFGVMGSSSIQAEGQTTVFHLVNQTVKPVVFKLLSSSRVVKSEKVDSERAVRVSAGRILKVTEKTHLMEVVYSTHNEAATKRCALRSKLEMDKTIDTIKVTVSRQGMCSIKFNYA